MEEREYVKALIQGLEKKIDVLELIKAKNEEQKTLLSEEDPDIDKWDLLTDSKGKLIDELNLLDDGFEEVYQHVKDVLTTKVNEYSSDIQYIKKLIRRLTDLSMDIQAGEARNKEMAEYHFARLKKRGKTITQSNRAAKLYKDTMQRVNMVDPQFFNEKH